MKTSIEVANVLFQNNLSEILLLQRSPQLKSPYIWGMPGGMVDEGETALRAAMRELKEETGIGEGSLTIAGIKKFLVETPEQDIRLTNIHATTSQPNTPVYLDPNEHMAYKWATEMDVYSSADLLAGSPTMIAAMLHHDDNFKVVDLTISADVSVTLL